MEQTLLSRISVEKFDQTDQSLELIFTKEAIRFYGKLAVTNTGVYRVVISS